jgi:GAF domain-containing protein
VRSVLSLPLLLPEEVVGGLNVYSRAGDAFSERDAHLGELFASSAAAALRNAQVLHQAEQAAEKLRMALISRAVIDQAIGIMIGRSGYSAEQGLATLRTHSQTEGTRLAAVAARIVEEAARRARARRSNP